MVEVEYFLYIRGKTGGWRWVCTNVVREWTIEHAKMWTAGYQVAVKSSDGEVVFEAPQQERPAPI